MIGIAAWIQNKAIKSGSNSVCYLKKKARIIPGPVEVTGVEPVTFCMPCKRSSQLS